MLSPLFAAADGTAVANEGGCPKSRQGGVRRCGLLFRDLVLNWGKPPPAWAGAQPDSPLETHEVTRLTLVFTTLLCVLPSAMASLSPRNAPPPLSKDSLP